LLASLSRSSFQQLQNPQLIRTIFPHALFTWSHNYRKIFLEIAWSFLSSPKNIKGQKTWMVKPGGFHRTGGLPAYILTSSLRKDNCQYGTTPVTISTFSSERNITLIWYYCQVIHRIDRDVVTHLTLPAMISSQSIEWRKHGKLHRKDRDARTHRVLPAHYGTNHRFTWNKRGDLHRSDWDVATATIAPAIVASCGKKYYIRGQQLVS
jgi:hypothetical protein